MTELSNEQGNNRRALIIGATGLTGRNTAEHLAACTSCAQLVEAQRALWDALDDPADPAIPIVINEVDCDTTGTDTAKPNPSISNAAAHSAKRYPFRV